MPNQDSVINLCCYINPSTISNQQKSQADIPDGYVSIQSDNGQHYLVPHFMILATHQAMEAYQKKVEFNVHMAHVTWRGKISFISVSLPCLWPMLYLLADGVYPLTHHLLCSPET